MSRVPFCFALVTGFALVGCHAVIESADRPEQDDSAVHPAESSAPGKSASDSGAATGQREGGVSFAPSNVPDDEPLTATSDWVFNTANCRSPTVELDTVTGGDSCGGKADGSYVFKTITRTDPVYGELTMGLFVTKNLRIEPNMTVKVVGNRPLVIAALESVTLEGNLEATVDSISMRKANGGGYDGAGNFSRGGGPGGGQAMNSTSRAGGGGYCGVGGSNDGNAGGEAYGDATLVPLLGGSAGGSAEYGKGGGGGGAIQIVAGTSIQINGNGVIHVGGGGGDNGGGGGSGGSILLEAPAVSVFGTLAANGGGGGIENDLIKGSNASPDNVPAKGGVWNDRQGGQGGANTVIDGQPGQGPGRFASGGGAVGRIRINTDSGEATLGARARISPALSTPCATQGTLSPR